METTRSAYVPERFSNAEEEEARLREQARFLVAEEMRTLRLLGLPLGGVLVDAGSGPGAALPHLREVLAPRETVAVDRDHQFARRCSDAWPEHHPPRVLQGSVASLPLRSGSADVVHFRLVLKWLSDPLGALREATRVLRPKGAVVVVDTDDAGLILEPEPDGFADLLAKLHAESAALGGDHFLGRKLYRMLREAGLNNIQVLVRVFTTLDVGAETFARILIRPLVSASDSGGKGIKALDDWSRRNDAFGTVIGFFGCGWKS